MGKAPYRIKAHPPFGMAGAQSSGETPIRFLSSGPPQMSRTQQVAITLFEEKRSDMKILCARLRSTRNHYIWSSCRGVERSGSTERWLQRVRMPVGGSRGGGHLLDARMPLTLVL